MSLATRLAPLIEARRGSRIDPEEGGRYPGIPRNHSCASVHGCQENRVRYRGGPLSIRSGHLSGCFTQCLLRARARFSSI